MTLCLPTVSTLDSTVILWNTASETKEVLRRVGLLPGNPGGFHSAQFSPDGRSLFAAHATAHNFRMWSTSKWTQARTQLSLNLAGFPNLDPVWFAWHGAP